MTESMSDHDIFISRLIRMTKKKDKEFKKFIDKNLFPLKSKSNNIDYINNNIDALRTMDRNQQLLVKARAKHFEETNDPSKYFPGLIAQFAVFIPIFTLITQLFKGEVLVVILMSIALVLFLGVTFYIIILFDRTIKIRSTAIYFNSLVTNIKYDEDKKTS